jgi:hypothetical protein
LSAATGEGTPAPVRALIEAAGIERVVYVDDAFAAGVEDLIAALAALSPSQRAGLLHIEQAAMAEEDLWQDLVKKRWEASGRGAQLSLVDEAYAIDGGNTAPRSGFLEVLEQLVPQVEHVGLSLAQWHERSEDLIADLGEKPTLLLFDQDFSQEGGGAEEGQKLIAELERKLSDGKGGEAPAVFYGLVTHKIEAGEEPERRNEIIQESDLDPMRFVLISKQNLDGPQERLVLRLRTMLLAPTFAQLMQEVSAAVGEAGKEAVERARRMTAEDLEHMVVKSSAQEGVWPADTMLRVLQILQRAKVGESVRAKPKVIELTERLRSMADLVPDPLPSDESEDGAGDESEAEWAPGAIEVAHEEIYEDGAQVNALHLPVALGDVFERGDGAHYVVVSQPCDLEVRSKGIREPDLSHVTLAKINTAGAADGRRFDLFALPYFHRGKGESAYVELGRPKTVRAAILDSCVLNEDGRARLTLDADPPALLLPYWQLRLRELAKIFKKALADGAKLGPNASSESGKAIAGNFKLDPFPILVLDAEEKVIEWDCRRIRRICDPYARALLARFSQYYARDAYLHDIARGEPA